MHCTVPFERKAPPSRRPGCPVGSVLHCSLPYPTLPYSWEFLLCVKADRVVGN